MSPTGDQKTRWPADGASLPDADTTEGRVELSSKLKVSTRQNFLELKIKKSLCIKLKCVDNFIPSCWFLNHHVRFENWFCCNPSCPPFYQVSSEPLNNLSIWQVGLCHVSAWNLLAVLHLSRIKLGLLGKAHWPFKWSLCGFRASLSHHACYPQMPVSIQHSSSTEPFAEYLSTQYSSSTELFAGPSCETSFHTWMGLHPSASSASSSSTCHSESPPLDHFP